MPWSTPRADEHLHGGGQSSGQCPNEEDRHPGTENDANSYGVDQCSGQDGRHAGEKQVGGDHPRQQMHVAQLRRQLREGGRHSQRIEGGKTDERIDGNRGGKQFPGQDALGLRRSHRVSLRPSAARRSAPFGSSPTGRR